MAKEIGVSQEIQDIVDACGFSKMTDAFESKNVPLMMLGYCDMRVMPHGIHSLQKRIDDLYVRYQTKISALPRKKKDFEVNRQATFAIEEYLFSGLPIKPEDINDESTKETVEKLKDYEM